RRGRAKLQGACRGRGHARKTLSRSRGSSHRPRRSAEVDRTRRTQGARPAHLKRAVGHGGHHSACSLASLMTLRHFGSSERMYFASCSGAPAIDSKYCRSRKFFLISESANIFRTSPLILSTMSAVLLCVPNRPNQETAS